MLNFIFIFSHKDASYSLLLCALRGMWDTSRKETVILFSDILMFSTCCKRSEEQILFSTRYLGYVWFYAARESETKITCVCETQFTNKLDEPYHI